MIDLDGKEVEIKVEEEYKRKRLSPFDWLNELNSGKADLFNEQTEPDFSPFMINRGLSQNIDTIMYANELNKHWHMTKQMVHDFYLHIIPKKKRYGKWAKQNVEDKDILDLIVRHYGVNRNRALEYMKLLSSDDINKLKESYEVGGKK